MSAANARCIVLFSPLLELQSLSDVSLIDIRPPWDCGFCAVKSRGACQTIQPLGRTQRSLSLQARVRCRAAEYKVLDCS